MQCQFCFQKWMAFIDVLFISCVELIRDVYNGGRIWIFLSCHQVWHREEIKSVQRSRGLYYVLCFRLLTHEKVFQVLVLILLWYTCAVQIKFCILLKTWVDTFALIQLSWLVIINSIVISNKMLAHIGLRVLLMLTGYIIVSWFFQWSFCADLSRQQFVSVHWYFYRQCTKCVLLNICQCFDITLL